MRATDHPESIRTNRIFSFASQTPRRQFSPRADLSAIRIAPDGKTTFVGPAWMVSHDLMIVHQGDKAAQNLTGASIDLPSSNIAGARTAACWPSSLMDSRKFALHAARALQILLRPFRPIRPFLFPNSVRRCRREQHHTAGTWLWDQKSPANKFLTSMNPGSNSLSALRVLQIQIL
jgi:hypothetical protein